MKYEFKKIICVEVVDTGVLELEFECGFKKIDLTLISNLGV